MKADKKGSGKKIVDVTFSSGGAATWGPMRGETAEALVLALAGRINVYKVTIREEAGA